MLKQVVEAENIKIRRSLLLYLHLIVLFLFPVLFGLYYGKMCIRDRTNGKPQRFS